MQIPGCWPYQLFHGKITQCWGVVRYVVLGSEERLALSVAEISPYLLALATAPQFARSYSSCQNAKESICTIGLSYIASEILVLPVVFHNAFAPRGPFFE